MSQVVKTAPEEQAVAEDVCPECGGTVRERTDEVLCEDCGLIVAVDELDRGPDWINAREADPQKGEARHSGPSTTEFLHDKGLHTRMYGRHDSKGNLLSGRQRDRVERMQEWHTRMRSGNNRERKLAFGNKEINRMGGALGLTKDRREQGIRLWKQAYDADLLRGRSVEGLSAACLYAIARIHGLAIVLDDVEQVARVSQRRIERAYQKINQELHLPAAPPRSADFVPRIVTDLGESESVRQRAEQMAAAHDEEFTHIATKPNGVAAAAVYCASRDIGAGRTQKDIAPIAEVSKVTLRDRKNEVREVFDE